MSTDTINKLGFFTDNVGTNSTNSFAHLVSFETIQNIKDYFYAKDCAYNDLTLQGDDILSEQGDFCVATIVQHPNLSEDTNDNITIEEHHTAVDITTTLYLDTNIYTDFKNSYLEDNKTAGTKEANRFFTNMLEDRIANALSNSLDSNPLTW